MNVTLENNTEVLFNKAQGKVNLKFKVICFPERIQKKQIGQITKLPYLKA